MKVLSSFWRQIQQKERIKRSSTNVRTSCRARHNGHAVFTELSY
jgi:hypothetical protein